MTESKEALSVAVAWLAIDHPDQGRERRRDHLAGLIDVKMVPRAENDVLREQVVELKRKVELKDLQIRGMKLALQKCREALRLAKLREPTP